MSDDVLVQHERDGAVLRITLNRPAKHNPLSRPVLAALRAAVEQHGADPALMCVVLQGAGNRYFAAGGDLRDLLDVRTPEQTREMAEQAGGALDALRGCPVPVLAVLNGDAIGGGAELALACDFRIMREGAHIGFIHGRLAISSAWGGGADLAMLIGASRALRMTARCEPIPAQTALEWGLADLVCPQDQLDEAVQRFIDPMLAHTPRTLRACTEMARAARRAASYTELREIERRNLIDTWVHADHWAAVDRFLARNEARK